MSYVQIIYEGEDPTTELSETNLTPILINNPSVVGIEDEAEENSCNTATVSEPDTDYKELKSLGTIEWSNRETNYLLKKYNKYIVLTGPRKRFRTKRDMWQRISDEINSELNINRSAFQCENRYKTVLRKWRKSNGKQIIKTEPMVENKGASPTNRIPFSTQNGTKKPSVRTTSPPKADATESNDDICKVLWEIFKKKEECRERRHKEKMELIQKLLFEFSD